jgi:hypothetical protein
MSGGPARPLGGPASITAQCKRHKIGHDGLLKTAVPYFARCLTWEEGTTGITQPYPRGNVGRST